jgi:hypothetical protein
MSFFNALKGSFLPQGAQEGEQRTCIAGAYSVSLHDAVFKGEYWMDNYGTRTERTVDALSPAEQAMDEELTGISVHGRHWFPSIGLLTRVQSGVYHWNVNGVVLELAKHEVHEGQYVVARTFATA